MFPARLLPILAHPLILYSMVQLGFLLILAMQAGAPGDAAAQVRQPYVIQLKGGTSFVGFWEEKKAYGPGKSRVEVDEPWNPRRFEVVVESEVTEATREWRQATEQRIKKGWEAAGYVLLDGGVPVSAAQFELAKRAREMAGVDAPEGVDAGGDVEAEASGAEASGAEGVVTTEPASGAPASGFFDRWGAHIGLLLVAVLLTGLVVRMTFLSGEPSL